MCKKDTKSMSLTEALRDGVSLDELRKGFESSLKRAQDEIAAEKEAQEKKDTEEKRKEERLNAYRRDLIEAAMNYLVTLNLIPEKELYNEEKLEQLTKALKDSEKELVLKMKLFERISTLAEVARERNERMQEKEYDTKDNARAAVKSYPSSDDVIARFLKTLS